MRFRRRELLLLFWMVLHCWCCLRTRHGSSYGLLFREGIGSWGRLTISYCYCQLPSLARPTMRVGEHNLFCLFFNTICPKEMPIVEAWLSERGAERYFLP
uniref:Putative secreted peptide n=1 Tax=Anopheles braziliensis TaxID=58242 RepID=A0A2M3ZPN6_9DIPT